MYLRQSWISVSIPSPRRSILTSPIASTSSFSHWMTVRFSIDAGSIGTMVESGSAVSTKPPTWIDRWRGMLCIPCTMRGSARTRASSGSRPARRSRVPGSVGRMAVFGLRRSVWSSLPCGSIHGGSVVFVERAFGLLYGSYAAFGLGRSELDAGCFFRRAARSLSHVTLLLLERASAVDDLRAAHEVASDALGVLGIAVVVDG